MLSITCNSVNDRLSNRVDNGACDKGLGLLQGLPLMRFYLHQTRSVSGVHSTAAKWPAYEPRSAKSKTPASITSRSVLWHAQPQIQLG